jgi:hypothetical protein
LYAATSGKNWADSDRAQGRITALKKSRAEIFYRNRQVMRALFKS